MPYYSLALSGTARDTPFLQATQGDVAKWFQHVLSQAAFTLIVYYRGLCKTYLQDIQARLPDIMRQGGQVFAFTSETQDYAHQARQEWALSFLVHGDPTHQLARHLRKEGLLNVVITGKGNGYDNLLGYYSFLHPMMRKYTQGTAQPALLVLTQTRRVLARWAVQPDLFSNLGGATDRPSIAEVWEHVQRSLAAADQVGPADQSDQAARRRRGAQAEHPAQPNFSMTARAQHEVVGRFVYVGVGFVLLLALLGCLTLLQPRLAMHSALSLDWLWYALLVGACCTGLLALLLFCSCYREIKQDIVKAHHEIRSRRTGRGSD
eukprot:g13508.t1